MATSSITVSQLSQVLWAAQGITDDEGRRTAPSAGQSYPLDLLVAAGNVDGLDPGLYRYLADRHELAAVREGDPRAVLIDAVGQEWLAVAPALLVVCAEFSETRAMYGDKGVAHVHVEAGAVVQNVYLQVTAMGLVTGFAGGFDEPKIRRALHLEKEMSPIGVLPIAFEAD